MVNNGTVPTNIVDKNGRATVVHKKPNEAPKGKPGRVPSVPPTSVEEPKIVKNFRTLENELETQIAELTTWNSRIHEKGVLNQEDLSRTIQLNTWADTAIRMQGAIAKGRQEGKSDEEIANFIHRVASGHLRNFTFDPNTSGLKMVTDGIRHQYYSIVVERLES